MFHGIFLLLVIAPIVAATTPGLGRVRELKAEMVRLRTAQPKLALAKGTEALTLLAATSDPSLELAVLDEFVRLQIKDGDTSAALKSVDRGELLASSTGNAAALRSFRAIRASIWNHLGNNTEATKLALEVLKEAKAAGDARPALDCLMVLAQCAAATGSFPQGIQYLHEGLEWAERAKMDENHQLLLAALSLFYIRSQDWTKALKANQEAVELAKKLGDESRLPNLRLNASLIFSRLGRPEEEYSALMEAEALGRKSGNARVLMAVEVNLADVLLQRKDYRGALERANRGLAMARERGDQLNAATCLVNRGIALNRMGQHGPGLASLEAGLKIFLTTESATEEAEVLGTISEEFAFAGDYKKALDYHRSFKEKNDKLYHDSRTKTVQELV